MEQAYTVQARFHTSADCTPECVQRCQWSITSVVSAIWVVCTTRGQKKIPVKFSYGRIRELVWDPLRTSWSDGKGLLDYSTRQGRVVLRNRHAPLQLARKKWPILLPHDFNFDWGDSGEVWDANRTRKKSTLVWQLWHRAITVNVWRGRIAHNIDISCELCREAKDESIIHRFRTCQAAQVIWSQTIHILSLLAESADSLPWPLPEWHQALFASKPPRNFKPVSKFWPLLRGLALWIIWTSRNHYVFNQERWILSLSFGMGSAYMGGLDLRLLGSRLISSTSCGPVLARFAREGLTVRWVSVRPTTGIG